MRKRIVTLSTGFLLSGASVVVLWRFLGRQKAPQKPSGRLNRLDLSAPAQLGFWPIPAKATCGWFWWYLLTPKGTGLRERFRPGPPERRDFGAAPDLPDPPPLPLQKKRFRLFFGFSPEITIFVLWAGPFRRMTYFINVSVTLLFALTKRPLKEAYKNDRCNARAFARAFVYRVRGYWPTLLADK